MNDKKVLVTGADGFIGSHLTEFLLGKGYHVRALAQYNSFNNWGWLEAVSANKNLEIVTGDIRDPHLCRKITEGIDVVFHLAALIAIPYSYSAPKSYIDTNVQGTLNMCQAAHDNNIKRFIHTSTSEVYGTAEYVPIDEKHPKQPQSPYSASKIGADAIALSYYYSFNLPLTVARPFNTYGPRQSARAFIPTIISQILSGKKTIKVGDLSPTRDLNYVKDTCRGLFILSDYADAVGQEVNISSNYEISMKDTLELIKKIMNSNVKFEVDRQRLRPKSSEVYRLWGDNSKLNNLSGFVPEFSLEKGLELTCKWFAENQDQNMYKADIYNV